jgi:hypothetical protein
MAIASRGVHQGMNFLLIVDEDDVMCMGCCGLDRRQKLINYNKYLSGVMHISVLTPTTRNEFCDCCKLSYNVRGLSMRRVLYALLPKENMYVPVDEWMYEYLKSQMLELMYILSRLGASNVKLNLERTIVANASTQASASLVIPNMESELGIKHNKVEQQGDVIHVESTFTHVDPDNVYTHIDQFHSDPSIYYLKEQQDWRDLIVQRLDMNASSVKFTFVIKNHIQIDRAFHGKVKKMGFELAHSTSDIATFSVAGEASF